MPESTAGAHDAQTSRLMTLVAELPEIYQPIYGLPLVQGARTADSDRIDIVAQVVDKVSRLVGRPLRILDLGSAQGYVAFRLSEAGHSVVGVEGLAQNVAVARAIQEQHPDRDVRFVEADILDCPSVVDLRAFDLVLGLSVLHHIVDRDGQDRAVELVATLAHHIPHGIFEMALAAEPVFWAGSLPADPRATLAPFAFIREIGRSGTHLSEVRRPLLFASGTHVLTGAGLREIRSWSDQAHHDATNSGFRRHFMVGDDIVKIAARFVDGTNDGPLGVYRNELRNEAHVLELLTSQGIDMTRLLEFVDGDDESILVRSSYRGVLLSVVAPSLNDEHRGLITGQVLDALAELEDRGLYHADLRLWNVIWDPDDLQAHLIDYGAVRTAPTDVMWPHDAYFSTLVWLVSLWGPVDDQIGARVPRSSRIDELQQPPRVAALIARLMSHPRDGYVFRDLVAAWKDDADSTGPPDALVPIAWLWLGELEAQRTAALEELRDHDRWVDGERATWAEERAELDAEHRAWIDDRQALLDRVTAFEAERAALAAEVEANRAARVVAEAEVAALRATVSWRVTGPLRSLRSKGT